MLFKDVLVDPSLKARLIGLARENRISHAQLFLAQSGSHAFALATALGQYLCCQNPGEEDSCGVCPSCVQFKQLSHPDLHIYFPNCTTKSVPKDPESSLLSQEFIDFVMDKDYHIDIEDWIKLLEAENKQPSINIRDAAHIVNLNSTRSYSGGYKIYILWCADRLYHDAAPKLLKTLEEPEEKSLFILLTENPDKILSTIISRTQLVKIPKPTHNQIVEKLMHIFPNLSDSVAHDLANVADGNLNKALKLHEDDSSQKQMLEDFTLIFESILAYASRRPLAEVNYSAVANAFEAIAKTGRENQKQFMDYMLRLLRNLLLLNATQPQMLKISQSEAEVLSRFKGRLNLKHISVITDLCNKAMHHISRNGNTALILNNLYLKSIQAFNS